MFVLAFIPGLIAMGFTSGLTRQFAISRIKPEFAVGLTAYVAMFLIMRHSLSWWQRRRCFQRELLYPWTRSELTGAVFAAQAWEMFTMAAACGLFAFGIAIWLKAALTAAVVLASIMVLLSVSALLTVLSAWVLTFRYALAAGLVAFIILLASLLGAGGIIGGFLSGFSPTSRDVNWSQLPLALWTVAGVVLIVSYVIARLAQRRWRNCEWALIPA